jgi:hypothetical protein
LIYYLDIQKYDKMKKSFSAPNFGHIATIPSPTLKRSTRMSAIPVNIEEVNNIVIQELQTEAVLHVSGLQAGVCALSVAEFPSAVLQSAEGVDERKIEMASCLMGPSEKESIRPSMPRPFSTSYLDLCETNEYVKERYVKLLSSVRRNRASVKKID